MCTLPLSLTAPWYHKNPRIVPGTNTFVVKGHVPSKVYTFLRAEVVILTVGQLKLTRPIDAREKFALRKFISPSEGSFPVQVR